MTTNLNDTLYDYSKSLYLHGAVVQWIGRPVWCQWSWVQPQYKVCYQTKVILNDSKVMRNHLTL